MNAVAYTLHVASGEVPEGERALRFRTAIGDALEHIRLDGYPVDSGSPKM